MPRSSTLLRAATLRGWRSVRAVAASLGRGTRLALAFAVISANGCVTGCGPAAAPAEGSGGTSAPGIGGALAVSGGAGGNLVSGGAGGLPGTGGVAVGGAGGLGETGGGGQAGGSGGQGPTGGADSGTGGAAVLDLFGEFSVYWDFEAPGSPVPAAYGSGDLMILGAHLEAGPTGNQLSLSGPGTSAESSEPPLDTSSDLCG